jgi:hypothetical protein
MPGWRAEGLADRGRGGAICGLPQRAATSAIEFAFANIAMPVLSLQRIQGRALQEEGEGMGGCQTQGSPTRMGEVAWEEPHPSSSPHLPTGELLLPSCTCHHAAKKEHAIYAARGQRLAPLGR